MESYSDQEFFTIEAIIGKKIIKGELNYLIKWKNYPIEDSTWESRSKLQVISNSLHDYDQATQGIKLPLISKEYQSALKLKKQQRNLSKTSKTTKSTVKPIKQTMKKAKVPKKSKSKEKTAKKSPKAINESVSTIYEYEESIHQKDKNVFDSRQNNKLSKSFCSNSFQIKNEDDSIERKIQECLYPKKQFHFQNKKNYTRTFSQMSPRIFETPTFGQSLEEGEIVQFQQLKMTKMMEHIEKITNISFVKKVQGETIFSLQNLYRVSFDNGKTLKMTTTELVRKHLIEFVNFLEISAHFY